MAAEFLQGKSGKIIEVGFEREQMLRFPKILGIVARGVKMLERVAGITRLQCLPSKKKMGHDVLSGNKSFTAFPGMEASMAQKLQSFFAFVSLVVKSNEFNHEIIAQIREGAVCFQPRKTLLRRNSGTFAKLIEFIEQSRICIVCPKCFFITIQCALCISSYVVPCNSQVSPGNRKKSINLAGTLPMVNGFFVPAFVIQQIAEIIMGSGGAHICPDRFLKDQHFFEARWEAVVRGSFCCPVKVFSCLLGLPAFVVKISECIQDHRICVFFLRQRGDMPSQEFFCLSPQASLGIIESNIETDLIVPERKNAIRRPFSLGRVEKHDFRHGAEIQRIQL